MWELVGVIVLLIILAEVTIDRPSRIERQRLIAFPKDRWTVSPSLDFLGKWGLFRNGNEYVQYDTRDEAEAKKKELDVYDGAE